MPVEDAEKYYDELLQQSTYLASTLEAFARAEGNPDLRYEDHSCVDVLRPFLLSRATYESHCHAANVVMAAVGRAYDQVHRDPELQRFLKVSPNMLRFDRGESLRFGPIWHRLDGLRALDGTLRFLELNTRPGGAVQNDVLADFYESMPIMTELRRRHSAEPVRVRPRIDAALVPRLAPLGAARCANFAMVIPPPDPGMPDEIDFTEIDTYPLIDQASFTEAYLAEHGGKIMLGQVDDFRFEGGRLLLHGVQIDIVYPQDNAFFTAGDQHPAHVALRAGAARLYTDFVWGYCVSNKAFLEILTDEKYAAVFGREQFAAVGAHVPWTRSVFERVTTRAGNELDLFPYIVANREHLVLKPAHGMNGVDVVLGWKVTAAQWLETLERGATVPLVVQERVDTAEILHPIHVDGAVEYVSRVTDFSPFVWDPDGADGAIIRMSGGSGISNLGSGGTKTALFVVD